MDRFLKILFFAVIVRPLVLIVLGLNVRQRSLLPKKGPAVIAANHNSHLDTLVLMSLYPLSLIHKIRPVAAADYFLSNPFFAWFSLRIIGIIPLNRSGKLNKETLFQECHQALDNGDILILFPEGTRGIPEQTSRPKKGMYYLLKDRNEIGITPVFMYGLGKALPRGEALLVPFNCDVVIGEPLQQVNSSTELVNLLAENFTNLRQSIANKL